MLEGLDSRLRRQRAIANGVRTALIGMGDGAAIQRQLDAAEANGGGAVTVYGPTVYTLNQQLLIPSNVELIGFGSPTLKRANNMTTPAMVVNKNYIAGTSTLTPVDTDIKVRGFIFDGNQANQSKVPFVDPPYLSLMLSRVTRPVVTDCEFINSSDDGLVFELCQYGGYDNIIAHDNMKAGVYSSGCEYMASGKLTSYSNGIGVQVSETWWASFGPFTLYNNGTVGGGQAGLLLSRDTEHCTFGPISSSNNIGGGVICNNAVPGAGTRHGVVYDGVTSCGANYNTFSAIDAHKNGTSGIDMQACDNNLFGTVSCTFNQTAGVSLDGCQNNRLANVKADNNSQVGAGIHAGVVLNYFTRACTGNIFDDVRACDTQGVPTQGYGIREDNSGGAVNSNRFRNVDLQGNTVAQFSPTSDSEVGTWVPTLTFATPGDLNVVYSTRLGRYTRKRDEITLHATVITSTFTHTTAVGALFVTGVPQAALTLAGATFIGSVVWSGITKAGYTQVAPLISSNNNQIEFPASGSGVAVSNVTKNDTPSGGTMRLDINITYKVARGVD